jgi:sugar O-acyltransferase (sialic acid O-acetyltransferase NeuD family)
MKTPLIIIGTGDFAEVAFYFLRENGSYEILGFSEELAFIKKKNFCDLPIFKFEELESKFSPAQVKILVAVGPNKINTVRERLFNEVKNKGYTCIRFIHPTAVVWSPDSIGENGFIFPGCIVEPFAYVGNNSALWSGSILAHHSKIEDHCFIAPGCTISGRVVIKNNCFLGINSTIRDSIIINERCIIGAGAVIKKDTIANGVYSESGTLLRNENSLTTKV